MDIQNALLAVERELVRAVAMNKPFNSHHEAYAVILEEVDEYWEEVKKNPTKRNPDALKLELVQSAAMCVRALVDLCEG